MKKYFLLFINIIMLSSLALAGDIARKGTTGADQLLVPVGARGIATGGAMLASLTGLESIYYNPAGLALGNGTELMFNYMSYIADINVSYFAAATQLGDMGTVAISFKTFDFGDIPVTTTELPDGTGSTYSPAFLTLGLTYSKVLTDRISVGTTIKFISETIENTSATGLAADVGVLYHFTPQFSMAATVKNIGTNMTYSGEDLQQRTDVPGTFPGTSNGAYTVVTESFQIPSFFELSLGYDLNVNEENDVVLGAAFTANNALEDKLNVGMEYSFMKIFSVRAGYNYLLESNQDNTAFGFSAGAGVHYNMSGFAFDFDYAFRDAGEFPTANHVFTVKLGL